jgi:hypothetical protein
VPDATPTALQRDRVLDRLRIVGSVQAIRDPQLNQELAPFRGHPPTGLLCTHASCTKPFLWCGLDATTARVRFGPDAPNAAASRSGPRPWQPDEQFAESVAPPGEPLLRWRFICPRCQQRCALSNDRMIVLIVSALAEGRGAIRTTAR